MATAKTKKEYNFGEKKTETIKGRKLPVGFITPKYKEARNKAIELLESEKYKGVLETSDFWILVNTYADNTKAMYSGLIISHDGCLKINDVLEEKLKFKPECMTIDKEGFNNSLVFTYNCPDQGIYEVGEVSKSNCKNDYPYAMALKRCMDRVILKNSRIAYAGIYSDSEADEFTKRIDEESITKEESKATKTANNSKTTANDCKQMQTTAKTKATKTAKEGTKTAEKKAKVQTPNYKNLLVEKLKELNINVNNYAREHKLSSKTTMLEAKQLLEGLESEMLD